MEELLLPSGGEEETRSGDSGPFVSGPSGGARTESMWGRVGRLLKGAASRELRNNLRDFCKRNGLLTLSVIAVLTGCTLGFMLRGTQLSTQVRRDHTRVIIR